MVNALVLAGLADNCHAERGRESNVRSLSRQKRINTHFAGARVNQFVYVHVLAVIVRAGRVQLGWKMQRVVGVRANT